jgi:beta-barrel assembly-enhancing protease
VIVAAARPSFAVIARSLLLSLSLAVAAAQAQGLPDLGDASTMTLSEGQERTIGNRIMREVRIDPAYVDDPDVTDYISALGNRLLSVSDSPRRDLSFFVVQDDTVNAFALIGGHVGIHTGLLLLTQNESELAGVMAHEIAHILQRHQARTAHGQRGASWASLAALALAVLASRGGSQGAQVTEAAVASAGALQLQNLIDYTREHEREADRVGLTLLERAGFDPRGMQSFFERMLRANRLNEFKGAPSYLRTHPLTTERIADIQDRIPRTTAFRMVPDGLDYRLARAKVRAASGTGAEAVAFFRAALEEKGVLRPREDVFGLALALRRTRDFNAAWETLAPLRSRGAGASHPAFETLAAELLADQGKLEDSLAVYRAALSSSPNQRGLVYGYLTTLLQNGRPNDVLAFLDERLRTQQGDAKLYELQARAFEAAGRRIARHRAQAEAYYRLGNLSAAVEQLEIAVKVRGSDFYEVSSAESRLRELRVQLEIERAAEKALKIS